MAKERGRVQHTVCSARPQALLSAAQLPCSREHHVALGTSRTSLFLTPECPNMGHTGLRLPPILLWEAFCPGQLSHHQRLLLQRGRGSHLYYLLSEFSFGREWVGGGAAAGGADDPLHEAPALRGLLREAVSLPPSSCQLLHSPYLTVLLPLLPLGSLPRFPVPCSFSCLSTVVGPSFL